MLLVRLDIHIDFSIRIFLTEEEQKEQELLMNEADSNILVETTQELPFAPIASNEDKPF